MGKILSGYLMPHPPILIKEVGKGEEQKVAGTLSAMERIAEDVRRKKPDTLIVITPHGPVFRDAVAISYGERLHGTLERFNAGDVYISKNNNRELVDEIVRRAGLRNIVVAKIDESTARQYEIETGLDHGSIVPLRFIEEKYQTYDLVHITYGMLACEDLYSFGEALQEAVVNKPFDVSIIASGDLSHRLSKDGPYGFHPSGPVFDQRLLELIRRKDYKSIVRFDRKISEAAGECGLRSLDILLGSLDGLPNDPEVLSYQKPFGIGYGVVLFHVGGMSGEKKESLVDWLYEKREETIRKRRQSEDGYVRLAREALENRVMGRSLPEWSEAYPGELLTRQAGVFVSLKLNGNLRGCIGTFAPACDTLFEEIVQNALKAGLEDPRFLPVDREELREIEYSVDVLEKPEKIRSIKELDPLTYGIIVQKGVRRGLLLPDLEGIDRVEKQLEIALQKANIRPDEDYEISRFKVERHH